jgi:hypothetical protein
MNIRIPVEDHSEYFYIIESIVIRCEGLSQEFDPDNLESVITGKKEDFSQLRRQFEHRPSVDPDQFDTDKSEGIQQKEELLHSTIAEIESAVEDSEHRWRSE